MNNSAELKQVTTNSAPASSVAAAIIERVRSLAPEIRQRASATEQARRVSEDSMDLIRETGVFKLLQPRSFGGVEAGFSDLARANMALGVACGSTAWCMSLGAIHNWMLALFPQEAQAEVWDNPGNIAAGSYMPVGKCERVSEGYRISGAWPFASNCDNSQWFIVGAVIPPLADGDPPQPGWFLVPRSQTSIVDTWFSTGMSGTRSKTIAIEQTVFVPDYRVLTVGQVNSTHAPGSAVNANPLYRLTFSGSAPIALISPALGIVAGAVADFEEMARTKMSVQPIDAVMAAVRHDLSQRDRNGLPDPGLAPAAEPPVDRIPVAVFGRNITQGVPQRSRHSIPLMIDRFCPG